MDLGFRMHAERTPNPNSIKWVLGQTLVEAGVSAHFTSRPEPGVSPLAARLFDVDGVEGVFLASNFVTITRREDVEWTDIAQGVVDVIKTSVADAVPALGPDFAFESHANDTSLVSRIRDILDNEIRPAVARDGGDIVFAGFREGIVELVLQGSCAGCPSSTATLKHGIEARLREAIPEVTGVAAV